MNNKLVLITQRVIQHEKLGTLLALEKNYIDYLARFINENEWVLCPFTNKINSGIFSKVTHVILTGGNDINPALYNQKPGFVRYFSLSRDAYELTILKWAVKNKIPVLGICRGMQLINVYFGGSLVQNIHDEKKCTTNHVANCHNIKIDKEIIPKGVAFVNSFHNQAIPVNSIGKNLKTFATSDNKNFAEGIYHTQYPVAGMMWHPERNKEVCRLSDGLFNDFFNKKGFWKTNN